MISERRGDMGFMEAMVSFMAVALVLTAFTGVLAVTEVDSADPTDGLDPRMFTGTIESRGFVPGFTGYIDRYVDSNGLSGASVVVTIPGDYCEEPEAFVIGSMDGMVYGRQIPGTVTDDSGRTLPAMFEVMLCA